MSKRRQVCLDSFDNVALETGEEGQHFISLRCRHCEFLQRGCSMLHKDRPVTGVDTQAFMGRLHIATRIENRASSGLTHIVDDQLAVPSETVLTVAFPKYAELGIIEQPGQEFIRDGGNGIIAAKAFVQGFRLHVSSPVWFLMIAPPLISWVGA